MAGSNDTRASARDTRPRRSRSRGSWWSHLTRGGRVAVVSVGVLAAVTAATVLGDVVASTGRVHPGVRVGGVAVGSLTPVQAVAKLRAEAPGRLSKPVTAARGANSWKITAEQVGAKVDAFASVRLAMSVGHRGGLGTMIAERFRALTGGVAVPAKVDGDALEMAALLDRIGKAVDVPARDATISVSATSLTIERDAPGVAMRRGPAAAAVLSAFMSDSRVVRIPVANVPVRVTFADARDALAQAEKLVAGPVTVMYGKKGHTVAGATVRGWVAFRADPVDAATGRPVSLDLTASVTAATTPVTNTNPTAVRRHKLVAFFDPARMRGAIAPFAGTVGRAAKDAEFVTSNGRVSIKPSQTGLGPDLVSLSHDLASACLKGRSRIASLKLTEVLPRLTTQQARSMGVSDRLGTFTTEYSSGNKERVNNVHLLASALNNKLVPPGGVFSFNGAAGERTASKGYQEAPAIVDGKLVPQLGGGVCQVGTTIFNAVFFSGLPILERKNHSFYISHYPKGRDCTVSWGGPDFKFKNDTPDWILIRTSFTNSSLTVSLYGTDPGYSVEYTTSAFTRIVPHPIAETKDPTLARGARLVEDGGVDGRDVTVVRTVYKGGQVVRTDTFVSHYRPKEEVVRVGTKAPSKPTTSTPKP